ncbi:Oxidoreductase [Minicystis rosea]|nr:Oxidoreductase [Minicystis rosea]
MRADSLDIAVIGLGTAGGAAALFLAREGHRVTLFERVPEPSAVGAGIMLQPTGQYVLARLGLLDHVLARGARVESLRAETTRGRVLFDLSYADMGPDVIGIGLHRGVLFETLFGAVRREPVRLELGVAIESISPAQSGKRTLTDAHGETRGPYDLVVIADGARSHLAAEDGPQKRVAHYPWGALWFVGRDAEGSSTLRQVVRSTQRMVGLLPTGLGPGDARTPLVSLFYSLPVASFARWHEGFDTWKEEVATLAPRAAPVLAQIERPDQVLFAAYHDVVMRRWDAEALVHIGDAAHATSPQLGQGANLALVDAMILADCLRASPSVREALPIYSQRRRPHLGFYQLASRWLTPLFQSSFGALGLLRDWFMPLAGRIPPVQRLMVQSMTGTVQGLLRAPLSLPAPQKPAELMASSATPAP